jgi:phage virion morphogenesis protein
MASSNDPITIDDLAVQTALAKLAGQIANRTPMLDAIGADLKKRVQLNFRNSQSPEGVAWEPLKSRSGKPLLDSGRLRDSIDSQTNGDGVSIGTNVIYAAVHQFGHTFNRQARQHTLNFRQTRNGNVGNRFVRANRANFSQQVTIGAHSVTIPARPFLPTNGLPPAWQDSIVRIIARHLLDGLTPT